LYFYKKYPTLQETNDSNKKLKIKVIELSKQDIQGIYDQTIFDQWYVRAAKQQAVKENQEIRSNSNIKTNFYSPLEEKDTNIKSSVIKIHKRYKDNQKSSQAFSDKKDTRIEKVKPETKMPRLERKKEVLAPSIQMTESEPGTQEKSNETKQEAKTWEVVNSKETKRNITAVKDKSSKTYLPINLPVPSHASNTAEQKTRYVIPMSITVTAKKNKRSWIKDSRIMVAVLQAMQNVYPDTYISPAQDDKTAPTIIKADDVPLEGHKIRQYLVTPVSQKLNKFHGKLFMLTNHTMKEYKMNREFLEYLRDEDIILEMNDLDDINPSQVGFLEHVVADYETLEMHSKRLIVLLPEVHPKFQLHINTLYAQTGLKTRVIMIKSDEAHVDHLRLMLEDLHNKNRIKFFPMNEYQSCKPGQKLTIVSRIIKWTGKVRNLLIPGFIDNDDDIPMVFNKTEGVEEPLNSVGVTEFLATKVKAGDGKNLFDHVYPPCDGIREVLFQLHQYAQAEAYVKVAHGELARNMDIEAMKLVFREPEKALTQATLQTTWTPHVRATEIQEMEIKAKGKYQPKRLREEVSEVTIEGNLSTTKTAWTTPPHSIFTSPETPSSIATNNEAIITNSMEQTTKEVILKELEAYKKLNDERMIELKQLIYSNARTANLNTESMVNMNERIKIISETVVLVDDRTEAMEKKMEVSEKDTNHKFDSLMNAIGSLTNQMEKNNQTVAHLASVSEANTTPVVAAVSNNNRDNNYMINQEVDIEQPAPMFHKVDKNDLTINLNDTMMSEHMNKSTYQGMDDSYISSISREDYLSGNAKNRANYD
jgi:hypothetical protein